MVKIFSIISFELQLAKEIRWQVLRSRDMLKGSSPEIEFRHELMGRLNKLDTEIELEVVPGNNNNNNNLHHNNLNSSSSPSSSSGLSSYGGCNLSSNGYDNSYNTKDYYYGSNKRDLMCSQGESDDSFLRPPLWEDITSSIQNIDPENAIMLSTLTGATQVKLEAVDDAFLEPLSSPLLSPLEIKTEKVQISLLQNVNNNNNNLHPHHQHPHHHHNGSNHISNNNNYHNNNNNNSSYQLNGSGYLPPHSTNGMHPSVHIHVQNNNYYTPPPPPPPSQSGWPSNNNNSSHGHNPPLSSHNLHNNGSYPPKFSPPPNLCPSQMSRLMYVPPLTPPNSDPGSPINGMQTSRGRSPPPPYHPSQQQGPPSQPQQHQITQLSHNQLTCTPIPMHTNNGHHPNSGGQLNHPHPHSQQQQHHHHHHHHPSNHPNQPYSNSNTTSTNNGNNNTSNMSQVNSSHNTISVLSSATVVKAVQRYNRRNNPELEKRRIHHCDFMGCTKVYTKSSHLKAHQRIHTVK
uniref:CSON013126 protein n=1 Tax=Culicoides sonorensis TaxID=179676 RepID=A0A336M7Y2_CULSO